MFRKLVSLLLLISTPSLGAISEYDKALLGADRNNIYAGAFETGKAGWVGYVDAAGSSPVDCTSVTAPTLSIDASSSTPITGNYSGLITKDAANRQGQGIAYPFTIDRGSRSQTLTVRFDYEVASGTFASGVSGVSDSDIKVFVYDVTNAGFRSLSEQVLTSSSYGQFKATFSTSSSTSYRLCFHQAKTGTSAYGLKIDNVYVGREVVTAAAPEVKAKYTNSTAQTFSDLTTTRVQFNTKIFDDLDAVTGSGTSSWAYVCPYSGTYLVSSRIRLTSNPSTYTRLALLKEGAEIAVTQDTAALGSPSLVTTTPCTAGQKLYAEININAGGTRTMATGSSWVLFEVYRIGN